MELDMISKPGKKRIFLSIISLLILLAAFTSCDMMLFEVEEGNLAIELNPANRGINWVPEIDMDIASYTITGTGPGENDNFSVTGFTGGVFEKDNLAVGEWEIVIDGYNTDDEKIATASIGAVIRKSQETSVTAAIKPLAGTGSLDVSVSWSDSQGKLADPQVFVVIKDESGNEIAEYTDPVQLTLGDDGISAAGVISDLPAGWFEVNIGLFEGIPESEAEAVWQSVYTLRIVKDEVTNGNVVIPEEEINFGEGSLSLSIEEEMENPFEISFTGLPESVKEEEVVTAAAAGNYGDGASLRWYVNGVKQEETTNELLFSADKAGLYAIILLVNENEVVSGYRQTVEVVQAAEEVAADTAALVIGFAVDESADAVLHDVSLPSAGTHGTRISWESSDEAYVSSDGSVIRPAYSSGDAVVQLTATVVRGTASDTKTFTVTVSKLPQTDTEAVAADKAALEIGFAGLDSADNVTQDVILAGSGDNGTTVTWTSSAPETISADGTVTQPDYTGDSDVPVTLTAAISKGDVSDTKSFSLMVKIKLLEQTVTFVSNGGSSLDPQTVYWGRLIEEPEAPTKVGFSFEGWYTDIELINQWDFANDYVDGDITLYAKWGDGYTISFDGKEGIIQGPTTFTAGYGVQYGTLAATARAGHTFLGWFTEPDGVGTEITADTTVKINADHILYAAWQAKTQTITFDSQWGTDIDPYTKVVTYGQPYGELPTPTRENHTFGGWWTEIEGYGSQATETTTFYAPSDLTLYAKWVFNVFTGPAGGLVFYENPNWETDDWRYLEAAPYGWYQGAQDSNGDYTGDDDPKFEWGAYGYTVDPSATATAIGTGYNNTANIVDFHDILGVTLYDDKGNYYYNPKNYYEYNDGTVAAKVCADFSMENDGTVYNDWFLPSKNELNQMYLNLKVQEKGGFSSYSSYWNSSESNDSYAWGQYFGDVDHSQNRNAKKANYLVRPIRAY